MVVSGERSERKREERERKRERGGGVNSTRQMRHMAHLEMVGDDLAEKWGRYTNSPFDCNFI